jgi:glycosyltransferase involved in cell wall biosynthesis
MSPSATKQTANTSGYRVLVIAHLTHAFANHIQPLANSEHVSHIAAIRPKPWTRTKTTDIDIFAPTWGAMPLRLISMFWMAAKQLISQRHDMIVTFTPLPYGLLGWILSKFSKLPYHVGVIGENVVQQLEGPIGILARRVIMDATTVSVSGDNVAAVLTRYGIDRKKIFKLPHGLTPEFTPLTDSDYRYDAIFVGDLLPVKQPQLLIEIWKRVTEVHKNACLCIVGDGPLRKCVETLIKDYNLGGNVVLTGFRSDVFSYLQQSRIFLLTSRSEGLPYAMIEAMACGAVPVVNDVGDIKELVSHDKNGLLLPSIIDIGHYTNVICKLISDENRLKTMSLAAISSINHLSYPTVTKTWNDTLEKLSKKSSNA